jgi:hypothetical protein
MSPKGTSAVTVSVRRCGTGRFGPPPLRPPLAFFVLLVVAVLVVVAVSVVAVVISRPKFLDVMTARAQQYCSKVATSAAKSAMGRMGAV